MPQTELHEVIIQRKRMPHSVDPTVSNISIGHATSLRSAERMENEKQSGQEMTPRNLSCDDSGVSHLLFRVLPVTLYGEKQHVDTYALLEKGSSL